MNQMGGRKKTKQPAQGGAIVQDSNIKKAGEPGKEEEMNRIMAGINTMDLDNENFIDVGEFDQSKAILDNAMEELNHYLKLFQKGDYKAFPAVKVE